MTVVMRADYLAVRKVEQKAVLKVARWVELTVDK
jgi:hypothetical protein